MIRIAIGGLLHESNSFVPAPTGRAAFERAGVLAGSDLAARWGTIPELAGFLDGAEGLGFEAVPTLFASAPPGGPVTAGAFAGLCGELLAALDAAGPVDAVLLALHGAMIAEGEDDPDALVLERVRERIGPDRPLVATLDYHANVSGRMAAASDALLGYRTYPHVDQLARGRRAAELAHRTARGEIRPTQAIAKPPFLIPLLEQETELAPMRAILNDARCVEELRGGLDASVLAGFPFADAAKTGPTVVVVMDGDATTARGIAAALGDFTWLFRRELTAIPPGPEAAVARALAEGVIRPALLIDSGDNIGGGAPGDSTVLAHELTRQGASGTIQVLHDPAAVASCAAAGVGCDVDLFAGGRLATAAPPWPLRGRVRLLHDGRYADEEPGTGARREFDQGLTAVVEDVCGNQVVLTSRPHPPSRLRQLTILGLQPERARAIVVKAAIATKAAYDPLGGTIVAADTPGPTSANPARFAYRHLRRPILPLDPDDLVERSRRG